MTARQAMAVAAKGRHHAPAISLVREPSRVAIEIGAKPVAGRGNSTRLRPDQTSGAPRKRVRSRHGGIIGRRRKGGPT